jgi:hypothetical protein
MRNVSPNQLYNYFIIYSERLYLLIFLQIGFKLGLISFRYFRFHYFLSSQKGIKYSKTTNLLEILFTTLFFCSFLFFVVLPFFVVTLLIFVSLLAIVFFICFPFYLIMLALLV